MDGQVDRQEQILMPPDYRHGGIKKNKSAIVALIAHLSSLLTLRPSF